MGTLRKIGRTIDREIIRPVVKTVEKIIENPVALASVALSVAAPGLGTAIGSALGATGAAAPIVGNAIVGGTLAEASGGDFGTGALTGGLGAAVAPVINPTLSNVLGSNMAGSIAGSAITGGTISELQGGDFLQGALQGAVTGGINQAANQIRAYSAYTPNADGSFTYQWDDGSTITIDNQANVLGYTPSSDIITAPIPSQQAQQDIQNKLGALDIAKTLTPYAVTALLSKGAYDLATKDDQGNYNYPVIPVPSDWKSPEYNMAFTPSAPIDFGSPELLQGTQWENPMTLSNLVNTLNTQPALQTEYQMPVIDMPDILQQFNVAPTVGMNETIGNLGGSPVSIADIIAGIQSGQNYSS